MTDSNSDGRLKDKARQILDAHADDLPGPVLQRLAIARRRALLRSHARRGPAKRLIAPWPMLATGTVAAIVVASFLILRPVGPDRNVAATESISDLDILTVQADLDLLEELDFMAWVAEQRADAG